MREMEPLSTGRPGYHFIAPQGWMNDPCAPGYDPQTGTYHLFYQWNPRSHAWGDITWGHATSKDLLKWTHDSDDTPVLAPDQPYDKVAVFTGCYVPAGAGADAGVLTVFYTSITALPVHYTLTHVRGYEGLSMATSDDGGKTWTKSSANPVLFGEPEGLAVTGFRDPYVFHWPRMDEARWTGSDPTRSLYGLLSGGLGGSVCAPRLFLYSIDPNDLTKWSFIRALPDIPPSMDILGADLGLNFECGSLVTLTDINAASGSRAGAERDFILAGCEGTKVRYPVPDSIPPRIARCAAWVRASNDAGLVLDGSGGGGLLDYGVLYAAAPFKHPDGRTVLWGWLPEEDVPESEQARKGWVGCFGVPREIFLARYDNVAPATAGRLKTLGFEVEKETTTGATVNTFGIRPLAELRAMRAERASCTIQGAQAAVPWPLLPTAPARCEMQATINLTQACTEAAIIVRHNHDHSISTRISYRPKESEIRIVRSRSTASTQVNTCDEVGAFTLLTTVSPTGQEELEPLRLRVFIDHDVLEVFANDRFAMSTWIYSPPECQGVSLDWNGDPSLRRMDEAGSGQPTDRVRHWDDSASVERVDIWEVVATNT